MTPPYTQPLPPEPPPPPPAHHLLLSAAKQMLEGGVKEEGLMLQLVELISSLEVVTITAKDIP